jgi:uncharacterized protein YwlG (UPF0340 family)
MKENIFVIGLDMDNKTPEAIGREAALKINDVINGLIEEQNKKKQEDNQDE